MIGSLSSQAEGVGFFRAYLLMNKYICLLPLLRTIYLVGLLLLMIGLLSGCHSSTTQQPGLWPLYSQGLRQAKYVDLTHTITPNMPRGKAFEPVRFARTPNPFTQQPFDYPTEGVGITSYTLTTDQLGTQLDPPAHWTPDYPAIDELPPTFTLRPLVVISIVEQLQRQPGYHLQVTDIQAWEKQHGFIPEGSVVFVRSDWSKRWADPRLAQGPVFAGVSLKALQWLHGQRRILFHGHEPLETDTTTERVGETWLLRQGYTQAEGVCNLDQVPPTGALVAIGYPKFGGGTGGYARFVAICPADWPYGTSIDVTKESPLPRQAKPLHWDQAAGMRVR